MDNYFIPGDVQGRKSKVTRIAFGVLLDLDQVDPIRRLSSLALLAISAIWQSLILTVTSCP